MSSKNLIVFGFCTLQTLLLIALSWQTSLNRTEVGHLGAAVYFYKTGQFDVFHVNPPLTRMIVGGPILLTAPDFDWKTYSPRPQDRSEWGIGKSFIHANTPAQIHWATLWARCALIPIILLGSVFGFRFASELYGTVAGYVFLTLWVFSPLVLAWGATICPDLVAASLGIVAVYTFWHWLKEPTWNRAVMAGICLGLLPLSKITWVIAFPLWLLIWIFWTGLSYRSGRPISDVRGDVTIEADRIEDAGRQAGCSVLTLPGWKQMAAILLIGLYLINMGYLFEGSFRPLGEYQFISHTLSGTDNPPGNRFTDSWPASIPVPLPGEFVQGIDTQKLDFERGIESYFRGTYSQHGWWSYYAYTVLVKEPLGVLCLGVLAIVVTLFVPKFRAAWRDELVVILPCLALFLLVSSQTGFSLHPRYLLPALPFAYLWISKLGRSFSQRRYGLATVTTGLLLWVVASSLLHFPHSMSYFNELVGSPVNKPKHLLGSNIEWGQDAYFLKTWYDTHPDARPLRIAYTPTESYDRLGITDHETASDVPEPGWYAIGVNELYGSNKQYEAFRDMEPVDRIGSSIFIYHVDSEVTP